jgi:hypothetical protein
MISMGGKKCLYYREYEQSSQYKIYAYARKGLYQPDQKTERENYTKRTEVTRNAQEGLIRQIPVEAVIRLIKKNETTYQPGVDIYCIYSTIKIDMVKKNILFCV